jgi:hypothetical protein
MRRIVINIDSLVLKGFRYEDRHAVAAGLQEELARLLATPQRARRFIELGHVSRLNVGNVGIRWNAKPYEIGAESARAIGNGLTTMEAPARIISSDARRNDEGTAR